MIAREIDQRKVRLAKLKAERKNLERRLNEVNYLILDEEQLIALLERGEVKG